MLTILDSLGPACWLWDYLRRSRTQGYFVPLSGGIDSCATAVIVYSMCRLVAEAAQRNDKQVIADARRIAGLPEDSDYVPTDAKEFCNRIFHTCYMGTENSSAETRGRAKNLAQAIGRYGSLVVASDLFVDTAQLPHRLEYGYCRNCYPQPVRDGNRHQTSLPCTWWFSSREPRIAEYSGSTAHGHRIPLCPAIAVGQGA